MTIERIVKENEWEGKFGKNQAYALDLRLADGTVEMGVTSNRKLKEDGSHNEPQEGETLMGTIEPDGRGGEKLRIDYDATREMGGAPRPSGGSTESTTSNNSSMAQSEKDRSIAWQVSLKVLSGTINERVKNREPALNDHILHSLGEIQASILDTGRVAAIPEPPVDLSGARTDEAGHTSLNFPKSEIPDDSHQWVESLLSVAGAADHAAPVLAKYAVNVLRPDQLKTLEGELNDSDNAVKLAGLRRVEASYVKAEGHPIPAPQYDDTIPF
jgi:hypothetical protein